jgi:hypothetical protein
VKRKENGEVVQNRKGKQDEKVIGTKAFPCLINRFPFTALIIKLMPVSFLLPGMQTN